MKSTLNNAVYAIGIFVIVWVGIKQIDAFLFASFGLGGDDSDFAGERSGLAVRTDALTGCQYLQSPWGGLIARIDQTGSPICSASEVNQ